MLLDLIEHQEELFAAIIASLNYFSLSALRATCKALFTAVSGAMRWQHMHRMQHTLRQINSIHRAILMDAFYDSAITIIYNKKNITCYIESRTYSMLEIYGAKNDHGYNIIDIIEYNPLYLLVISDFRNITTIPKWLSKCTNIIIAKDAGLTEILDIRP